MDTYSHGLRTRHNYSRGDGNIVRVLREYNLIENTFENIVFRIILRKPDWVSFDTFPIIHPIPGDHNALLFNTR